MFYVYIHRKKTNGEVFYVGKGCGKRAWSKGDRSKFWKDVALKYGFTVEIYINDVQEWYAYEVERELISYYGRRDIGTGSLVNMTNGGGLFVSEYDEYKKDRISNRLSEARADKTIYSFTNIKTGEVEVCTRLELCRKHKIPVSNNLGRLFEETLNKEQNRVTVNDWCLTEKYDEYREFIENKFTGKYNPNADHCIYYFYNCKTKEEFTGTRLDFCEKYKINRLGLCQLFSNKDQVWTIKNWCVPELIPKELFENLKKYGGAEKGLLNPRADRNIYHFKHKSGDEFIGTRFDFQVKYGFSLFQLFQTCKTRKGWYLVK